MVGDERELEFVLLLDERAPNHDRLLKAPSDARQDRKTERMRQSLEFVGDPLIAFHPILSARARLRLRCVASLVGFLGVDANPIFCLPRIRR